MKRFIVELVTANGRGIKSRRVRSYGTIEAGSRQEAERIVKAIDTTLTSILSSGTFRLETTDLSKYESMGIYITHAK